MNVPGFTAEASVYNTTESYRTGGTDSFSTMQVVPQLIDFFSTVKKCCKYVPSAGKFICDYRRVFPGESCTCRDGRVVCRPPVLHRD